MDSAELPLIIVKKSDVCSGFSANVGFLPYFKAPDNSLFLYTFYRKPITFCLAILYLTIQFIQVFSLASVKNPIRKHAIALWLHALCPTISHTKLLSDLHAASIFLDKLT